MIPPWQGNWCSAASIRRCTHGGTGHLLDPRKVPDQRRSLRERLMNFEIGVAPETRRIDKATLAARLLLRLRARGGYGHPQHG
jgi:hypothetical protein